MAEATEEHDYIEVPDNLFQSPERIMKAEFRAAYELAGIANAHQLKIAALDAGETCSNDSAQTAFEKPQEMTQKLMAKVLRVLQQRGIDTEALMDRVCRMDGLHESIREYEQVRLRVATMLESFLALNPEQQDMLIYQVRGAASSVRNDGTTPYANACRNMGRKLRDFIDGDECKRMF